MTGAGLLIDSQGRILRDLRVSITDRCNFRCLYCLPETEAAQNFYRGHWAHLPNPAPIVQQWVPKTHILSFEEIERVVRLAVSLGIQKVRLTGGEPLLRHDVEDLVARIASIPGLADLAMTTNGFALPAKGARAACRRPPPRQLQPGFARRATTSRRSRAATVWTRSWRASAWRRNSACTRSRSTR